jgi:hypothetical protein
MITNYKCTFGLKESKSTSVTQKRMPGQREQYGSTVHLFIDTGRSPCKITTRPFVFDNNSIVIYRGLGSLFLFKSVSSFRYHVEALLQTASALRHPPYPFYASSRCGFNSGSKIPIHTLYSRNIVKIGPSEAEGPQQ